MIDQAFSTSQDQHVLRDYLKRKQEELGHKTTQEWMKQQTKQAGDLNKLTTGTGIPELRAIQAQTEIYKATAELKDYEIRKQFWDNNHERFEIARQKHEEKKNPTPPPIKRTPLQNPEQ